MDRDKLLRALFDIECHCQYLESCIKVKDWSDVYVSSLVDDRVSEIEKRIKQIRKTIKF